MLRGGEPSEHRPAERPRDDRAVCLADDAVYEGVTLAERLRRGILDLDEAHEVFVPIARALDALHRPAFVTRTSSRRTSFSRPSPDAFIRSCSTSRGRGDRRRIRRGNFALRVARAAFGAIKGTESLMLSGKMDTYCLAQRSSSRSSAG